MNDLLPTIIELEDDKLGYFYSPQQLEAIRYRNLYRLTPKEIYGDYNSSSINNRGNKKEIV